MAKKFPPRVLSLRSPLLQHQWGMFTPLPHPGAAPTPNTFDILALHHLPPSPDTQGSISQHTSNYWHIPTPQPTLLHPNTLSRPHSNTLNTSPLHSNISQPHPNTLTTHRHTPTPLRHTPTTPHLTTTPQHLPASPQHPNTISLPHLETSPLSTNTTAQHTLFTLPPPQHYRHIVVTLKQLDASPSPPRHPYPPGPSAYS